MSRAYLTPALALLAVGAAALAPALRSAAKTAPEPPPTPQAAHVEPVTASGPGVQVTAEPDRAAVLADGDRRVRVRLGLKADASTSDAPRVPTDLVVVLDRSGSMTGDKILDAKAAASELVGQLGAEDRFALVSFASDLSVDLPLTVGTVEARQRAIDALEAGGGTDMRAGLATGLEVLGASAPGRARRVVLISDGLPDTADPLPALARRAAVMEAPLTAIGIGMDYDETLMQTLADAGTGNFHWVERGPQLSVVLADELDTARETVASGVRVALRSDVGARIVDAAGYPIVDGHFDMGSLFAGQHRSLWVTLELPPGVEPGDIDPGAFEVRWLDTAGAVASAAVDLDPVAVTRDKAAFFASVDEKGWADCVVNEDYNDLKSKVSAALQRGDVDEAQAEITAYRSEVATMNAVVDSAAVRDNLAEVDALEQQLAVQAQHPKHVQNAWAKGISTDAYQGRRSGQSKSW